MNILKFLFALIERFVPIETVEMDRMKLEAKTDWDNINLEKPLSEQKGLFNKITYKAKELDKNWQVRLFLSVLFIFAVRWVTEYMNPKDNPQDLD